MASPNRKKSRRIFLRDAALTTLSLGLLPDIAKAKENYASGNQDACNATTLDYYGQGPFYRANPPEMVNNQLASGTEPGTRLILSGVVRTLDCSAVIPNALIDVWQANNAGHYDNSGFNLRGLTYSNSQGFYVIETILPGKYLNGPSYRPRHIHFKITPKGFPAMTTQLYFKGDTDIPGDAAASISSGIYNATHRIIPIALNTEGKYEGVWDIIINGDGIVGTNDIHLDRGIIYSASPNPFTEIVEIHYGLFCASKVSVEVFDIQGSLAATLHKENLPPNKYKVTWRPNADLPNGFYFVVLKLNDLQVHYMKILKV